VCLVAVSFVAFGCAGDSNGSEEASLVRATELKRLRALVDGDVKVAETLHADDFELINPLGETIDKATYMIGIENGTFDYTLWRPVTPIRVRLQGDGAVIRYESELTINGTSGRYWHTDYYEKRDGRWQVVWSQATTAP
jgi:hypothetical protein